MATGKIIIKAQDQTKSGVNSAKKNLSELNEVASSLGINLGKLTVVGTVTAGLVALAKGAQQCAKAFLSTENTYLALEASLKKSSGSYTNAITQIDKLSKTTLTTKSDIAKLYTELVQLGKGEEEINKILEASISLANVTGKDLNSSMELLLGTYQGSAGELTKYLPKVSTLTKEELELGKAVDLVNDSLSDVNNTIAGQSYTQSIKNIKDDLQTIAETWGAQLVGALGPVIQFLENSISKMAKEVSSTAARKNITKEMGTEPGQLGSMLRALYSSWGDYYNESYGIDAIRGAINSSNLPLMLEYMATLDENDNYEAELLKELTTMLDTYFPSYKSLLNATANAATKTANSTTTGSGYGGANDNGSLILKSGLSQLGDIFTKGTEGLDTSDYAKTISAINETQKQLTQAYKTLSNDLDDYSSKYSKELTEAYKEYTEKLRTELTNIKTTILSTASSLVSSSASSYLTDSQLESYNSYLQDALMADMKQALKDLESSGQKGSEEYKVLNQILDNMIKGFDKTIPSNVKSVISANTKYFDEDTKIQYEIAQKEEQLATYEKLLAEAQEQLRLGNGSQEDIDYLIRIIEGIKKSIDEDKNATPSSSGTNTGSSGSTSTGETFSLDWDAINDSFANAFGSENADLSIISDLTSGFGELLDAMGAVGSILLSSDPLLALLVELIASFCSTVAPFVKETLAPLNEVIDLTAQLLTDAILPILQVLKGVAGALAGMLKAVIVPVMNILSPILELIATLLKTILYPVLKGIAYVFIFVGTVIDLVATSLQWVIAKVINWFASWVPWVDSVSEPDSPSWSRSWNKMGGNVLDDLDSGFSDFNGTSTDTAVSNASYQGGSNFYFNIYQQAPVVGEGGMQEFAIMLKKEFAELAYVGA